jgi:hypothetical protein
MFMAIEIVDLPFSMLKRTNNQAPPVRFAGGEGLH